MFRPNGCPSSPVGMFAFWAPMHAGSQVLFAENYTMKPYVKKGYVGGPAQYATDLVAFKIPSSQHKALPTGTQSNTLLASQLHWFSAASSKDRALDCKQRLVKLGMDRFDDSITHSTSFPCLRFSLGAPVERRMKARIAASVLAEDDVRMINISIDIDICPLRHLGIPTGKQWTIPIHASVRYRDDQPTKILGVFMASPHASVSAYARFDRGYKLFAQGQALDAICNFAIMMSGVRDTPGPDTSRAFTTRCWPTPQFASQT